MKPAMNSYVLLEITSADVASVLDELICQGITLWDIEIPEPLTAYFKVSVTDAAAVRSVVQRRGDSCRVQNKKGILWFILRLRKRYVFLLGVALIAFLTGWLPTKILFYEVNGCDEELEYAVIDIACAEGVFFGSETSNVQSGKLKNSIISGIPEVEWAGVTVRGCVAVIDVKQGSRERDEKADVDTVSHIVAVTDGIVESVTAEKGVAFCVPGQVVRQGQILISGYEDCDYSIKATNASGEVIAYTHRNLTAVTPLNSDFRTTMVDHKTDFSLMIGKKQINLYNNSGISEGSCVKMYTREYVSLPGGYQLPIALVREDYYFYDYVSDTQSESSFQYMEDQARDYVILHMLAGEILSENGYFDYTTDLAVYSAAYACREQIGISKNEETLINDRIHQ